MQNVLVFAESPQERLALERLFSTLSKPGDVSVHTRIADVVHRPKDHDFRPVHLIVTHLPRSAREQHAFFAIVGQHPQDTMQLVLSAHDTRLFRTLGWDGISVLQLLRLRDEVYEFLLEVYRLQELPLLKMVDQTPPLSAPQTGFPATPSTRIPDNGSLLGIFVRLKNELQTKLTPFGLQQAVSTTWDAFEDWRASSFSRGWSSDGPLQEVLALVRRVQQLQQGRQLPKSRPCPDDGGGGQQSPGAENEESELRFFDCSSESLEDKELLNLLDEVKQHEKKNNSVPVLYFGKETLSSAAGASLRKHLHLHRNPGYLAFRVAVRFLLNNTRMEERVQMLRERFERDVQGPLERLNGVKDTAHVAVWQQKWRTETYPGSTSEDRNVGAPSNNPFLLIREAQALMGVVSKWADFNLPPSSYQVGSAQFHDTPQARARGREMLEQLLGRDSSKFSLEARFAAHHSLALYAALSAESLFTLDNFELRTSESDGESDVGSSAKLFLEGKTQSDLEKLRGVFKSNADAASEILTALENRSVDLEVVVWDRARQMSQLPGGQNVPRSRPVVAASSSPNEPSHIVIGGATGEVVGGDLREQLAARTRFLAEVRGGYQTVLRGLPQQVAFDLVEPWIFGVADVGGQSPHIGGGAVTKLLLNVAPAMERSSPRESDVLVVADEILAHGGRLRHAPSASAATRIMDRRCCQCVDDEAVSLLPFSFPALVNPMGGCSPVASPFPVLFGFCCDCKITRGHGFDQRGSLLGKANSQLTQAGKLEIQKTIRSHVLANIKQHQNERKQFLWLLPAVRKALRSAAIATLSILTETSSDVVSNISDDGAWSVVENRLSLVLNLWSVPMAERSGPQRAKILGVWVNSVVESLFSGNSEQNQENVVNRVQMKGAELESRLKRLDSVRQERLKSPADHPSSGAGASSSGAKKTGRLNVATMDPHAPKAKAPSKAPSKSKPKVAGNPKSAPEESIVVSAPAPVLDTTRGYAEEDPSNMTNSLLLLARELGNTSVLSSDLLLEARLRQWWRAEKSTTEILRKNDTMIEEAHGLEGVGL